MTGVSQDHEAASLQQAARRAFARGDIARAAQYLEFAEERCHSEARLHSVKMQLAEAYWHVRPADSAREYLSLKAPALAGKLADDQVLRVATGMLWHLQMDDAAEVINHFCGRAGPGAELVSAEAHYARLIISSSFPGIRDRLHRPCSGGPNVGRAGPVPGGPDARAVETLLKVLTRTADECAIAQAQQMLADGKSLSRGRISPRARINDVCMAMLAAIYADRLDVAAAWCDRFLAGARTGADDREWALIATQSAQIALRQGRLDVAADRARAALSYYVSCRGWCVELGLTLATLVEAYTAMGEYDIAAGHLRHPVPPAMFQSRSGLHYLFARGRHHLAIGHKNAALGDFMACGERMTRWGIDSPALVPWRVGAAEAWLGLDETARAARLAEEQMTQLGAGLPRASGVSLRCLAAVQETTRRPALLRKALQLLQQCGDRYESARVLGDLSRAYWALGARTEARSAARRAWRLAKDCHAEALCQELAALCRELWPMCSSDVPAADVRPAGRSPLLPEGELVKLSSRERRVALLAAEGFSNREISSKLLVTVSTVEQHLTRIYRKMNIKSRYELLTGF
ncbi:MAG TPA: helix-turn-helix transcriptional regulator [Streptosporangiaceae bacterium]|nr:helix-turn-helix transcriptional regulator [Streptosporangiaceae bacterium]